MRRRLRVRLLLWTLAALALCAGVVHGLHALQMYRGAAVFYRQADRAIERHEYAEALLYLNHYLTFAPDDVEALVKQVEVQDKLARTGPEKVRVLLAMEQVLRRAPARKLLRERTIALAQRLGRLGDAIRHLKALIAAAPTDAVLEHHLARCHISARDYPNAAEALRRAIAKDPAHLASYARLAELLQYQLDQATEVVPLLNELVAANPGLAGAWLLRARYYRDQNEPALADRDLNEALRLAPLDADVLLAAAERARAQRQWAQACTFLEQALQTQPMRVELYKTLAAVEVQRGQRTAALAWLRRGLERVPASLELRYYLTDQLIDAGELPAAENELARIRKAGGTLVAEYLRARLLQERREWFAAVALLLELRGRLEPLPAWLSQAEMRLGRCYEELGDAELEIAAYRRALAGPSFSHTNDARLGLARALMRVGAVDEALSLFEKLGGDPDAPPAMWAWWARALVLANGRLPEKQRDWAEVERLLTLAELATPHGVPVTLAQVEKYLARQQPVQAEATLRLARDRQPRESLLWAALVDLAARQQQWSAAQQTLTEARRKAGDTVALRLAEVRLWARRPPGQAVKTLATLAKQPRQPLTTAEQARWLHELAQTLYRLGGRLEAKRVWQQLAAEQPNELRSRFVLFELAIKARDRKQATALVADLRRIEGAGGLFWRACEAEVLIALSPLHDQAALDQARKLLAEVPRGERGWSRLIWLLGALAEREGQVGQALDHYLRALEAGERQPGLAPRVLRLLTDRRRYEEAERVLRFLDDAALTRDSALRELAVRVALRRGNVQRALALAHQSGAAESRDYRDQLWLAQVLQAAGQTPEARALLERAVANSKAIPDVWVALVRHLVWSRDLAAAEKVLAESQRQLPAAAAGVGPGARATRPWARWTGRRKSTWNCCAQQPDDFLVLEELARFYRQQEQWVKAEGVLRRLLAGASGVPEELLVSARRQLASVLAAQGGSAARAEGLALVALNERVLGRRPEEERARAVLLATQPGQLALAVKHFEKTLEQGPLQPDEQFQLVQLYAAQGEAGKSSELLRDLLAEGEVNVYYLAYHVHQLILQGELDDAQFYLTRLERSAPRAPRTAQLQALLHKTKAKLQS